MRGLMGPYFLPELASVCLEFHRLSLNQYRPVHWLRWGLKACLCLAQLHLALGVLGVLHGLVQPKYLELMVLVGATPVGEREPVFQQQQQPLLVLLLDLRCEGVWERVQLVAPGAASQVGDLEPEKAWGHQRRNRLKGRLEELEGRLLQVEQGKGEQRSLPLVLLLLLRLELPCRVTIQQRCPVVPHKILVLFSVLILYVELQEFLPR